MIYGPYYMVITCGPYYMVKTCGPYMDQYYMDQISVDLEN